MQNIYLKNNLKTIVLTLAVIATAGTGAAVSNVFAQEPVCYGPYGEIIPCPLVNKSFNIQKAIIQDGNLVEEIRNVGNGRLIDFQLTVKNTGELNNTSVMVVDSLPSNLTFVSLTQDGNTVQVSADNTSISWTIEDFDAGEQINYVLKVKADDVGITEGTEKCVTNIGSIYYKGKAEGSDTAVVCIKKGEVKGDKKTPQVLPDTDIADLGPVGIALIAVFTGGIFYTTSRITKEQL